MNSVELELELKLYEVKETIWKNCTFWLCIEVSSYYNIMYDVLLCCERCISLLIHLAAVLFIDNVIINIEYNNFSLKSSRTLAQHLPCSFTAKNCGGCDQTCL